MADARAVSPWRELRSAAWLAAVPMLLIASIGGCLGATWRVAPAVLLLLAGVVYVIQTVTGARRG